MIDSTPNVDEHNEAVLGDSEAEVTKRYAHNGLGNSEHSDTLAG